MTDFMHIKYVGTTQKQFFYNGSLLWTANPGNQLTIPASDLFMYLPPNSTGPIVDVDAPSHGYNGSMEPRMSSSGYTSFVNGGYNSYLGSGQAQYQQLLNQLFSSLYGSLTPNYTGDSPYIIIP